MDWTWGVLVTLVSSVVSPVTSHNIRVNCKEYHGFLDRSDDKAPSVLADLKATLLYENPMSINISWALNVDNTLKYVEGFHITYNEALRCDYNPPLSEADFTETDQIWFSHVRNVMPADVFHIQAANLPLPPPENGPAYKSLIVYNHTKTEPPPAVLKPRSSTVTTTASYYTSSADMSGKSYYVVEIVGGVMGFIILLSCYMIYKSCRAKSAVDFKRVDTSPTVPILVVYPAENTAFQWAVVTLAELLQQHGRCSVAIDIWQQGNIAKLGPMRWLVEQVKDAERVLIVCPQATSTPDHSPPLNAVSGASIPAAATDLYPLALNLAASQAKNCSELAKFWVVQLGDKPSNMAPELKACRRFCLMKDLNKLGRCLQRKGQENTKNIANIFCRSKNFYSGTSTKKLHAAIQALNGQPIMYENHAVHTV